MHRRPPAPLGVKLGIAVIVGPPAVLPAISAAEGLIGNSAGANASIMGKVLWSTATWVDEIANGFGFGRPFNSLSVPQNTGGPVQTATGNIVPARAFIATTAAGSAISIASAVQSWLARKVAGVKQVRLMNRRVA